MPVEGIDPINYLNWVLDFFFIPWGGWGRMDISLSGSAIYHLDMAQDRIIHLPVRSRRVYSGWVLDQLNQSLEFHLVERKPDQTLSYQAQP